ncbi:MAG: molybdenum cofactor biosynthesis protein MoaE [Elusimicrobiota bacterium]
MDAVPYFSRAPIDVAALEGSARAEPRGAVVTFQSVVRGDRTRQGQVDHLLYEADEPAALSGIARLLADTKGRWPQCDVLIQHRLGPVGVGETTLFIAVEAPRKSDAFEACRHLMDGLKTSVPISKRDVYTDGRCERTGRPHEAMLVSDGGSPAVPTS